MKTKKILSVLSVASLMAACSSEEFEAPKQNSDNLALRPIIDSEMVFNFGAETRLVVGEKDFYPTSGDGDMLGAAVIDKPTYSSHNEYNEMLASGSRVEDLYEFTEYISSNYPYTNKNGVWTTPAELVEGNYLFYAPFSKKNLTKAPIIIVTPAAQDASTEKKAIEDLAKTTETPVLLAAQFLKADGSLKPAVRMYDVFSYPLFTIENNFDGYLLEGGKFTAYNGKVKVKSVKLVKAAAGLATGDASFIIAEAIDNGKAAEALPKWDKTTFSADAGKSGTWSITPDVETGDVKKAENGIITTLTLDNEIENGGSYSFYAVMPAAEYESNLCALVNVEINGKEYVIKTGTIRANASKAEAESFNAGNLAYSHNFVIKEDIEDKTGVTLLRGQRYPREMMNFDAATGDFSSLKKNPEGLLTINLKGGKIVEKNESVTGQVAVIKEEAEETRCVDDNEGLLALCDKQNNLALAEVATVDDIATINDFVIAEVNTITVNADLIKGLVSKLSKGSLTVSSVLAIDTKEVEVKGVENIEANKDKITFVVKGTEIEYPITMATKELVAAITDDGTYLAPNSAVEVTALPKNTTSKTYKVNIINNGGETVTISATENFESLLSVSNLNGSTLVIGADLDNKELGIYNAGTLTINNYTNAFINNAEDGEATIAGSAGIFTPVHNNGKITPATGASVTIASGAGVVVNDALANVTNNSAEQEVNYTFNAAYSAQVANSNKYTGINTVIFGGTVTASSLDVLLTPIKNVTTVKTLIFKGNVTTEFEANKSLSGMTLKFAETATWKGVNSTVTKFTDAAVEVAKDKVLTLDNITVNGTKSGEGSVKANMSASTDMK